LVGPRIPLGTAVNQGLVLDEWNVITSGRTTQIILGPVFAKQGILGVLIPVQENCFGLLEQWRR
jgi:hypothetical protein